MTALQFNASLNADGTLNVPREMAEQLKNIPAFRVLVLVPGKDDEDEAWDRMAEAELFRAYSESDSVYDDL